MSFKRDKEALYIQADLIQLYGNFAGCRDIESFPQLNFKMIS